MRAKFITVKGPERLADEPFYMGVLQHDRTMSRREAYEYIAEKTGYKPTAVRACLGKQAIQNVWGCSGQ